MKFEPIKCEKLILVLFLLALGFNVYGVSYHFTMGFMAGHEFRQAQTAVTSYYIDKDNNFGLLYETPILGKPWVGLLLEVPVYEWSVVGLSRATGWPQVVAARTVSASCFYVMLVGLYLLLGRLAVPRSRRLLILALVLATPVYIFYSRAFLMDSMALMWCVWWLYAFVRTMEERKWRWLILATVAGSAAALIKSATLAIWLIPGAAYGAWLLWRDMWAGEGWRRPFRTLVWGLGTVVVALGLLKAWISYTDPIKAAHPSAWIFTSKNLSEGNWGLFDLKVLLSAKLWHELLGCWEQAIMSRWLIAAGLIVGLLLPKVRWKVLGIGGVFFVAQLLFPFAYAYQDYYFYSCAVFLSVALGFMLLGLLDTPRVPWWCAWMAALGLLGSQFHTYWSGYWKEQKIVHQGGYPITDAIRELTPKNSVIVVAGADWAAMTPLYAQRRALMVRNGLEYDHDYLKRAFDDLDGEVVTALVVWGKVRTNRDFIEMATKRFDMDSKPTFSWNPHADVYVARYLAKGMQLRLLNSPYYAGISMLPGVSKNEDRRSLLKFSPEEAEVAFRSITPAPYQAKCEFGLDWMDLGTRTVLSVHPDTDLWIKPPGNAKQIEWTYGIFDSAFHQKSGQGTDGVDFIILAETKGGGSRVIYHRLLDPANKPSDRGDQHELIPYRPLPGEILHFCTRPNRAPAYDWAYTVSIHVE